MGFVDKVKAQAAQVAEKAQEGIKTGQEKVEEAQSRRKTDALLRELGALVYARHTGGASEGSDADIDRIVAEIRAQEDEHPAVAVGVATDGATAPPTTGGDFTLDGL